MMPDPTPDPDRDLTSGAVDDPADLPPERPADGGLPELDPVEQRVLGSLLEKERTVPATYPLTLNALRTACNQASSRDPVVDYDDATVTAAVDRLKARGLARIVYAGSGARAMKYRQVADERLDLDAAERAVVTLLLLRGPQAPGELKTRAERLHPFGDRGEVETCLEALAARAVPLVRQLERQPGQQDRRWIHLLGPVDVAATSAPAGAAASGWAAPVVDREVVLAAGPVARTERVVAAYDALAPAYAAHLADELDHKPFDRWLLERLAALADGGPVADVGCGPGHVAFHLALAGAEVTGFDLSPAMVAEARRRFPDLAFEVADLTALPAPGAAPGPGWAAIAAWYSLVHLAGSELRPAIGLLASALAPGGWLAVAVHVGDEVRHLHELFDTPVELDVVLHDQAAVVDGFAAAGLVDVEWYRRSPNPAVEAETERLYVIGRRPAPGGPTPA
jgi:uncharacterized protein YceH (UPF0502 family)/SAM-dependent methyltransferase